MMILYRVLCLPALLLVLPHYLLRMRRRGGLAYGFYHRLGMLSKVPRKQVGIQRIWIQAVSVGELLSLEPLLKLLKSDPKIEVALTTTTTTGYRLLRERLTSYICWGGCFPFDFLPFSSRAWGRLQPDMAVLMESELWPEHLQQARKRKVPVYLLNARMSPGSFRNYRRFRNLVKPLVLNIEQVLAGSATDAQRFQDLDWLPNQRIRNNGNFKYDLDTGQPLSGGQRRSWLSELGFAPANGLTPLILLGASTWPGEEAALMRTFLRLQPQFPQLRLLIVPRHQERKAEISSDLAAFATPVHFRSDAKQAPPGSLVYVADTTGELRQLTQLADLVFVGKSLPPHTGGQTPFEAAAFGKPIICGHGMESFRDLVRALTDNGAAMVVANPAELTARVAELLEKPDLRDAMSSAAIASISHQRGASERAYLALKARLELLSVP